MLNRVELIGRLGRDAHIAKTEAGTEVANLSIATEIWSEQKKETLVNWVDVTLWEPKGVKEYLTKGRLVYIEAIVRTRKVGEVYRTDVISKKLKLLDSGGAEREQGAGNQQVQPVQPIEEGSF